VSPPRLAAAPLAGEARRASDLLVLDRVRIRAWDRILFVECGDGWIVEEAWRRAGRAYVCGLDRSVAHVELAKRLREIPGKVEFSLWDGQRLPVPDLGFNRVVATLDSMRAHDPAALFRDLRRVLRPDGDGYLLQSVSHHGGLPHALAEAGWPDLHELARTDDHTAVLLHIRPAASTPVA